MPGGHKGRVTSKALEYLKEVVEPGFSNSGHGAMVGRFEKAFAERFGVPYAIAFFNGTTTMHACLAAAGVKPGDEVIVPPLTYAATSFAVLHQGAVPVFADVDARTFNLSPESIQERITPLTRAVIPVGLYGLSADMDPIMEIAARHKLAVIEDNAQCVLGQYKGRLAGTNGHMASFSLQASKHLTSGEGGVVLTKDEKLATGIRKFGCFGYHTVSSSTGGTMRKEDRGHPTSIRHDFLGWNYRMSGLQAAVALEQVERIDELVGLRIKCAEIFAEAVRGCEWLTPQYTPPDCVNSFWTFVCLLDTEKAGCTWDEFRNTFFSLGGDFVYGAWRLTYNEPVFQERKFLGGGFPLDSEIYQGKKQVYKTGLCPVAEAIQPRLLQFKTNYCQLDRAAQQAEILAKTIKKIKG